ncbi:MAG: DNA-directed RNA polymerase subunit N [Promethearchaeota archaeon]
MIIPVRCFTCGREVASLWEPFMEKTQMGIPAEKVLDEFGLDRLCCRRMLVSHRNLIDDMLRFTRQQ